MINTHTYFVTLAAGHQGSATASSLLKHGQKVHVFVRNKNSIKARELEKLGCKLFEGSASDPESVDIAIAGCQGIFLNFCPGKGDPNTNLRQAKVYLTAAARAGLVTVVATTSFQVGMNFNVQTLPPDSPWQYYFASKLAIEEEVQKCSIKNKICFRPAWLMQNYMEPLCNILFHRYKSEHILDIPYEKGCKMSHFDAHDLGELAAAALMSSEQWNGETVELGNEKLGFEAVAATISKATGIQVQVNYLRDDDVNGVDGSAKRIESSEESNSSKYICSALDAENYGVKLTSFEDWVEREKVSLQKILG